MHSERQCSGSIHIVLGSFTPCPRMEARHRTTRLRRRERRRPFIVLRWPQACLRTSTLDAQCPRKAAALYFGLSFQATHSVTGIRGFVLAALVSIRALYCRSERHSGKLVLCDLQTGNWRQLAQGALGNPEWSHDRAYLYAQNIPRRGHCAHSNQHWCDRTGGEFEWPADSARRSRGVVWPDAGRLRGHHSRPQQPGNLRPGIEKSLVGRLKPQPFRSCRETCSMRLALFFW
jgi:hypothetical protein